MRSFLSLLFVSATLFTSCKKETEAEKSTVTKNVVPFTQINQTTQTAPVPVQNQSVMSPQVQQDPNIVNQNNALAASAPVAPGMNPVHGKPGHRCDIPVGAPINSPVKNAQSTPQQNKPLTTTTVTPTPNTNPTPALLVAPTPEGMNPPHGQTGHRCDISVGAPLPKE